MILAGHRVNSGASLPAHAATPQLSQIVTPQAPAAARGESQSWHRHWRPAQNHSPSAITKSAAEPFCVGFCPRSSVGARKGCGSCSRNHAGYLPIRPACPGDPQRGQASWFARLTQVLGAVAQSGSAPRSHRGGQGFKSPQLHPGQGPVHRQGTGLFDLPAAANGSNGQVSQSPSLRSASRVASDGASV